MILFLIMAYGYGAAISLMFLQNVNAGLPEKFLNGVLNG
jgi:hypothetical protein